ncbi:MAG TPA: bacterial transcriptional activator domain-containing protein [Oscillatoriaceae cyanobacterium]
MESQTTPISSQAEVPTGDSQRSRVITKIVQALGDTLARLKAAQVALGDAIGGKAERLLLEEAHSSLQAGAVRLEAARDPDSWDQLLAQPEARARKAAATVSVDKLQLRCLGGFEVRIGDRAVEQWPRRKAQLLLMLLMLYPRGLRPEELAEMLDEGAAGPSNIRVYARALRRALSDDDDAYVLLESQRYRLNHDRVDYFDLKAFERGLDEGNRLRGTDPVAAATAYEAALEHYRGNLMEDAGFLPYFTAEREQYRRAAVGALMTLAEHYGVLGDRQRQEACLQRATVLAPCEEEAYLALIRHHLALGRPEKAHQAYWDCRKAMKAYLGISPSAEFEQTFRGLV